MKSKEPIRKVSAFISLYSKLLIAIRMPTDDFIMLNPQDVATFEHLLTEDERIEHKDFIKEAKECLSQSDADWLRERLLASIKEMMNELSPNDLDLLKDELRRTTLAL